MSEQDISKSECLTPPMAYDETRDTGTSYNIEMTTGMVDLIGWMQLI